MTEVEMTLSQVVDSKWTKLASRLLMGVIAVVSGFIGVRLTTYDQRIAGVEVVAAEALALQKSSAQDSDRFQVSISGAVATVQTDVSGLTKDMQFVRGILEEMRRRDVAVILK